MALKNLPPLYKQLRELIPEIESIKEQIEEIYQEEIDSFDSMPENIQMSLRGANSYDSQREMENALEWLQNSIDMIEDLTNEQE